MLVRAGAIKNRRKLVGVGLHWVILCFETNLPRVKNHTILCLRRAEVKSRKIVVQRDPECFVFVFVFFEVFILVIQTHLLIFLLTGT